MLNYNKFLIVKCRFETMSIYKRFVYNRVSFMKTKLIKDYKPIKNAVY